MEESQQEEQRPKEIALESHTIALMISTAAFFDVLQWVMAFILMDWLISIFAYLTFFVWFAVYKIKFTSPKRFLTAGTSMLLEIIPFVAALPALTVAVTIISLDTKIKKIAHLPTLGQDKAA